MFCNYRKKTHIQLIGNLVRILSAVGFTLGIFMPLFVIYMLGESSINSEY